MITRRVLHLLVTAIAAAALAPSASATLLVPGTTVVPSPFVGSLGTLVADTGLTAFTYGGGANHGHYQEQVYRTSGGTLDFVYFLANDATSSDAFDRMTTRPYASNIATDAQIFGSGQAPNTVSRNATGTIAFNFELVPGQGDLMPGSSSDSMVIVTDARSFRAGTNGIIDGGSSGDLPGFAPVVPEASTVVGFGMLLGLGGLAMLRLRRRAVTAAAA